MSDGRNVDAVASGRSYVVCSVHGRAPTTLEEFVGSAVVAFTVTSHDQVVEICGSAHLTEGAVVVHEKDKAGTGKDVRTWHVGVADGCFTATERSIY